MKVTNKFVLFALAMQCVACTTAPILPEIETFSASVDRAISASEAALPEEASRSRVDVLRREAIAARGGVVVVDDADGRVCEPIRPSGLDPTTPPPGFSSVCQPRAALPSDPDRAFEPSLPDADPAVAALNARELLGSLQRYATGLGDLAASEGPKETAAALSGALGAARDLGVAVAGDEEVSSETQAILTSGTALLETASREALEARRYALLRDLVTSVDDAVGEAVRVIATAAWLQEQPEIESRYDAMREADNAARPGNTADIASVEEAVQNARAAEDGAVWRTFFQIGVAHRAIRDSLNAPADLSQLIAANERIGELALAVDKFVQAVSEAS